jgi:cytochrome P450
VKSAIKLAYRKALRDTSVGDLRVPEGTLVMTNWLRAVLESGEGGEAFNPAQWLDASRRKCTVNDGPGNMSFGAGQRRCVGQHLAMAETIATLAIFGREVGGIEMSEEEATRQLTSVEGHPTGLPLRLLLRRDRSTTTAGQPSKAAHAGVE